MLGLVALVLVAGSGPSAVQDAARPVEVPVGGVIMWWGLEKDVPAGFEVCDGRVPVTPGAILEGRKPDLRGRFPMGAPDEYKFRPWEDNTGGSDSVEGQTAPASIDKPPPHEHPLSQHSHSIKDHTHDVPSHGHTGKAASHDHDIGTHGHAIEAHAHPLPDAVRLTFAAGDADDEAYWFLLSQETKSFPPKDVQSVSSGANTKALATGDSAKLSTEKVSITPSVNDKAEFTTSKSSKNDTGPPKPAETGTAGEVKGHAHSIAIAEMRPRFTRLIFIVRVK
jgi:hypothetical protein